MDSKEIIVAGNNDLAFNIVELLSHRHFVTLVGPESAEISRFSFPDNVEIISGQVTEASVLSQTPLTNGGVFIAATDSDERNILACMTAVALIRMALNDDEIETSQTLAGLYQAEDLNVICILNRSGKGTLSNFDDNFARELHIHRIIRPAQELADEIIQIAAIPHAQDVKHIEDGIMLLRVAVDKGALISNQSLRDARLPSGVLVVVVARDDEIILPSGDTVISAGDRVTILGQQRDLLLFARNQLLNPRRTRPEQRATIVGGGEAGRLVALGLLNRGWAVDILEKSSDTIEKLDLPEDIVVRRADGTEMQSFEINDVASSSLLVAVTSSDETNLLVSLLAQYVGIDRIITRADRLSNERMFERLGVDVVRSARGAAIRRVVREITGHDEVKAELEHGALQMIEVKVHSQFGMIGLADLQRETGLKMVVGAISRRDPVTRIKNWVIPNGKTKIESGDTMYIICDHLTSESALGYFGSARIGE